MLEAYDRQLVVGPLGVKLRKEGDTLLNAMYFRKRQMLISAIGPIETACLCGTFPRRTSADRGPSPTVCFEKYAEIYTHRGCRRLSPRWDAEIEVLMSTFESCHLPLCPNLTNELRAAH